MKRHSFSENFLFVMDLPGATGLSHAHLSRLRRAGQFVPSVRHGLFKERWTTAEVRAWVRARARRKRLARRRQ
jgi:hypothetical protein